MGGFLKGILGKAKSIGKSAISDLKSAGGGALNSVKDKLTGGGLTLDGLKGIGQDFLSSMKGGEAAKSLRGIFG